MTHIILNEKLQRHRLMLIDKYVIVEDRLGEDGNHMEKVKVVRLPKLNQIGPWFILVLLGFHPGLLLISGEFQFSA